MDLKKKSFTVWAFLLVSLGAGFVASAGAVEVHTMRLKSPPGVDQRTYLGIKAERFAFADMQADIIIVELFSLYCALCAKEAPAVAELFALAHKRSTPEQRIVLLGIGAGNTADEVARFQKQHAVPFPVVPDKHMTVARSMNMAITPAFIAFKKRPDGSLLRLHTRLGLLGPPQRFLDSVLQAAAKMP